MFDVSGENNFSTVRTTPIRVNAIRKILNFFIEDTYCDQHPPPTKIFTP